MLGRPLNSEPFCDIFQICSGAHNPMFGLSMSVYNTQDHRKKAAKCIKTKLKYSSRAYYFWKHYYARKPQ